MPKIVDNPVHESVDKKREGVIHDAGRASLSTPSGASYMTHGIFYMNLLIINKDFARGFAKPKTQKRFKMWITPLDSRRFPFSGIQG